MSKPLRLWISAGETSGDVHGQLLVQALRQQCPDAEFAGMAGPAMRAAGVRPVVRAEDLSVMGFTEVLVQLPKILELLRTIKANLAQFRPDVLVVIDAPDFHFRVIRLARALNIPVIYYISPKLWAWRAGRARFLHKHVERLISILPFEVPFYARYNMAIDYVGHPLLDTVRTPEILAITAKKNRIGILPGSRTRELSTLLPLFARAADLLMARYPDLEFVLPVAPGLDPALIDRHWTAAAPLTITESAQRYAVMRSCQAIMAASGTATLETALLGVPTLVAYKFSRATFCLAKLLIRVPYISLPNLVLAAQVFPEFLQDAAQPATMAAYLDSVLRDGPTRSKVMDQLATLPELLGSGGAASRAAAIVLKTARNHADT